MITKEVLYVDKEGGHYHITLDEGEQVHVYRWEGDKTWQNPGELVAHFDAECCTMMTAPTPDDICSYLVLCSFLRDHVKNYMGGYAEFISDRSGK